MVLAAIGFIGTDECLIAADQPLEHEAVIDVRRGSLDLSERLSLSALSRRESRLR
jgi:hypothetical protein